MRNPLRGTKVCSLRITSISQRQTRPLRRVPIWAAISVCEQQLNVARVTQPPKFRQLTFNEMTAQVGKLADNAGWVVKHSGLLIG
jgi:hypothetical protein